MEVSNYVFKTNEAVLMPTKVSKGKVVLRSCIWIVVSMVFIGSFLFDTNLFTEFSWTTRILLILLVVKFGFGGKGDVPSPIELHFYDDYLILYRPKRYYSRKVTRMEVNKMMYKDIKSCVYKRRSQRLHIYGNVIATWYNYDSNGVVSQVPTYNRVVEDSFCYFSTRCAEDVDFKQLIESHSPLQVILEDS